MEPAPARAPFQVLSIEGEVPQTGGLCNVPRESSKVRAAHPGKAQSWYLQGITGWVRLGRDCRAQTSLLQQGFSWAFPGAGLFLEHLAQGCVQTVLEYLQTGSEKCRSSQQGSPGLSNVKCSDK